jgi:hypothetical protein
VRNLSAPPGSARTSGAETREEWQTRRGMSNVVNLNRFRKKKTREAKVKEAEINRIRHGRTRVEKERELAERSRLARLLEGKRLEHDPKREPEPASEGASENEPESPPEAER